MAKEEQDINQETPELLEDSLSKTEVLLDENKDLISKVVIAIAIIIGGYFFYNNWIVEPAEQAAFEEIWPAQKLFEQDSVQKAISEFDIIISLSARRRDLNKKHISIKDFSNILKKKKNINFG